MALAVAVMAPAALIVVDAVALVVIFGFLLDLAECMIVAGIERKESRGAHARPYDFPERDDENYMRHTLVTARDGAVKLNWKPVTVTKWQPMERTY